MSSRSPSAGGGGDGGGGGGGLERVEKVLRLMGERGLELRNVTCVALVRAYAAAGRLDAARDAFRAAAAAAAASAAGEEGGDARAGGAGGVPVRAYRALLAAMCKCGQLARREEREGG